MYYVAPEVLRGLHRAVRPVEPRRDRVHAAQRRAAGLGARRRGDPPPHPRGPLAVHAALLRPRLGPREGLHRVVAAPRPRRAPRRRARARAPVARAARRARAPAVGAGEPARAAALVLAGGRGGAWSRVCRALSARAPPARERSSAPPPPLLSSPFPESSRVPPHPAQIEAARALRGPDHADHSGTISLELTAAPSTDARVAAAADAAAQQHGAARPPAWRTARSLAAATRFDALARLDGRAAPVASSGRLDDRPSCARGLGLRVCARAESERREHGRVSSAPASDVRTTVLARGARALLPLLPAPFPFPQFSRRAVAARAAERGAACGGFDTLDVDEVGHLCAADQVGRRWTLTTRTSRR